MKPGALARMTIRGLIPFASALRAVKRQMFPYRDDPGNSNLAVSNALEQLGALAKARIPVEGRVVLEFGTG